MKIYAVGGAVRDTVLGRPVHDRDWVVVGASPEQMCAAGFRPVGRDFPVFLHPDTHEEYALARTERKVSSGYHGFTFHTHPNITLEQDLQRRDLTINAMALAEDGTIIDPYGGLSDLKQGILRHVSAAFAEDPVRILRVARFAARFDFEIAPETNTLMCDMVNNGEVDALVPERIWQEFAKGLMEQKPSRMIRVLLDCGALARIAPEIAALFGVPQRADYHPEIDCGEHSLLVLDYTAQMELPLAARFAALCHDLGKALTPKTTWPHHHGHEKRGLAPLATLCQRVRVPNECRELAQYIVEFHTHIHRATELRADTLLKLLLKLDALRRPERFELILAVCRADARGRLHFEQCDYPQYEWMQQAFTAIQAVNTRDIALTTPRPHIASAIYRARLAALKQAQSRVHSQ